MKKLILHLFMLLLFIPAIAQKKEQVFYYYKGQKVYYPVSYDRLVVGIKSGHTFNELKNTVAALISVPADSLEEGFGGKQILVKLGINKVKDITPIVTKLKQNTNLLYSRPVFKSQDGKYNSYSDEFIVNLKASTSIAMLQSLMTKYNVTVLKKYPFLDDMYILTAGAKNNYDGLAMANFFYETGLFDYAEPNKCIYNALLTAPNDPLYNLQWAHKNTGSAEQYNGTPDVDMKVQEAWTLTMGSPDIKIGVIDEGVDLTHPDLQANLLQGFNGATMTSNPGDGAPTSSYNGHGTACAGIIAARANNGIGVAGVAPNCKIIPAVIFGGDYGYYLGDAAVAASFDYVRLQGADVISNSWGGGSPSSSIDDAIHRAVTLGRGGKGCMVLCSSGNYNSAVSYPANNPEVISVGGISMCGQRKSPSSCDGEDWGANYGIGLDVVAPCVKIATTDIQGTGGYNNAAGTAGDYYNIFNGTSSACPNAAGVAALILSANSSLTVAEATQLLELSCTKLPNYTYEASNDINEQNGTWNNETGFGNVNAFAAVQSALNPDCSLPVQIQATDLQYCNKDIVLSVFFPIAEATYQWRRGGVVIGSGNTLTVNTGGSYDVVKIKGGCTVASSIINITNNVTVTASADANTFCNSGGTVLTASALVKATANYCSPTYSSGTRLGDFISLVSIAGTTLNNATGASIAPFYTLYPQSGATTASLSGNTSYTMSVTGGTYNVCYIRGWIDYNQDGVFDASESIGISGNVGASASGSIVFTLPANIYNGETRLRLRSSDTNPGPGIETPCGATNSGWGEAEDYLITITGGVSPLTYSWTETPTGTTLESNNTAVVTASNINQTTTYTVTATTGQGCVSTSSDTVTINPLITWYPDVDGDGYGDANTLVQACTAPNGYVSVGGDCNDLNASIQPGAPEVCDGIDNNCDGQVDEGFPDITYYRDADGDGYGNPLVTTTAKCATPAGYVTNSTDCDDQNASVHPGAP
ncbi:S8 family serine peptidase, partial [Limnovirga soli]